MMKKIYQSPAIRIIPLTPRLSLCNYSVNEYETVEKTTIGDVNED